MTDCIRYPNDGDVAEGIPAAFVTLVFPLALCLEPEYPVGAYLILLLDVCLVGWRETLWAWE